MKGSVILMVLACVVVAGCDSGQPAQQITATRGVVPAVIVKQGPPIDGTMNSAIWKKCPPLEFGPCPGEEVALKTTARVLFDATRLYVAWECIEDDTASMKAEAAERDDNAWNDDSVELFISGGPRVGSFHFAVNSEGVLQDWKISPDGAADLSWDSSAVVRTSMERNKRWIVTMSVPLKELGAYVGEGQTWPMNLNRTKPAGPQQWIESSWSDKGLSTYGRQEGWGKIVGVRIPRRADGVTRTAEAPKQ